MKYGYLFYQKPLIKGMKTRPVNLGDPIQSYAVKNLYREMGIQERDIIPVSKYEIATYEGEECVCIVNLASDYEELAYESHFMPPSSKIHAIPMSFHIHRDIPADELDFYRTCGGVGCRDISTYHNLKKLGIDTYLSGCLTLTLPKRSEIVSNKADKIYFIDVGKDVLPYIPNKIKVKAVELTNVIRVPNPGNIDRFTVEDTYKIHQLAEDRVALLRDTAKLVVTSRLHIACPCIAIGIPVILVKEHFGDRYGFVDRLIPTYTPEFYDKIDWDPEPIDIEEEKQKIKNMFFDRVNSTVSRLELEKMWEDKSPIIPISYDKPIVKIMERLASNFEKSFKYAVWGVVLAGAYYLEETIREQFPEAELVRGIDIASNYDFCGVPTIHPDQIEVLDKDVIIFVAAPSAQEMAKERLMNSGRRFILLKGNATELYNFEK